MPVPAAAPEIVWDDGLVADCCVTVEVRVGYPRWHQRGTVIDVQWQAAGDRPWSPDVQADVSVIGAFIVPMPGATIDRDAVFAVARDKLAAYKVPREIILLDALPRTANGKLQRKRLSADFEALKT